MVWAAELAGQAVHRAPLGAWRGRAQSPGGWRLAAARTLAMPGSGGVCKEKLPRVQLWMPCAELVGGHIAQADGRLAAPTVAMGRESQCFLRSREEGAHGPVALPLHRTVVVMQFMSHTHCIGPSSCCFGLVRCNSIASVVQRNDMHGGTGPPGRVVVGLGCARLAACA